MAAPLSHWSPLQAAGGVRKRTLAVNLFQLQSKYRATLSGESARIDPAGCARERKRNPQRYFLDNGTNHARARVARYGPLCRKLWIEKNSAFAIQTVASSIWRHARSHECSLEMLHTTRGFLTRHETCDRRWAYRMYCRKPELWSGVEDAVKSLLSPSVRRQRAHSGVDRVGRCQAAS